MGTQLKGNLWLGKIFAESFSYVQVVGNTRLKDAGRNRHHWPSPTYQVEEFAPPPPKTAVFLQMVWTSRQRD